MNKQLSLFLLLVFTFQFSFSQEKSTKTTGVMIMSGLRYDDVRMCIATPAGVKGGPIGDIMLSVRYAHNEHSDWVVNIPVFRPIMFALTAKMLQFEPEMAYEKFAAIGENKQLVYGPGVGLSFHYGPGYTSSANDNREPSFFAFGPIVNYRIGIWFAGNTKQLLAFKAFYTPLFSFGNYENGHVLGGALQYTFYFGA